MQLVELIGIDLIDSIKYWNQPMDDPLRWWLQQPRCMERKIEDALWVRPVDVAAALVGRRYSSAGALVFRMRDEICPWNDGVFRLQAGNDGTGECTQSNAVPDIELTPYALGALYLGGNRFSDLARSGVLTGTPAALNRADAMFRLESAVLVPGSLLSGVPPAVVSDGFSNKSRG